MKRLELRYVVRLLRYTCFLFVARDSLKHSLHFVAGRANKKRRERTDFQRHSDSHPRPERRQALH